MRVSTELATRRFRRVLSPDLRPTKEEALSGVKPSMFAGRGCLKRFHQGLVSYFTAQIGDRLARPAARYVRPGST